MGKQRLKNPEVRSKSSQRLSKTLSPSVPAPPALNGPEPSIANESSWWGEKIGNRFLMFQVMPSWLVSFLVHLLALLLFALLTWRLPQRVMVHIVTAEGTEEIAELSELNFEAFDSSESILSRNEIVESNEEPQVLPETDAYDTVEYDSVAFHPNSDWNFETSDTSWDYDSGWTEPTFGDPLDIKSQLSRRRGQRKLQNALQAGATAESEHAVALALEWLARQQKPDGRWVLHEDQRVKFPIGATCLALLTFLGAGETHLHGEYQEVVEKGFAFLLGPQGGELTEHGWMFRDDRASSWLDGDTMYSHGLAAICLCEAYAMTDDSRLFQPAQEALRYIEYTQDRRGGGWRYVTRQRGDLSVTGFQIMALKSANLNDMKVSKETVLDAIRFLDAMSSESGTYYGYTAPGESLSEGMYSMTAVGLLCRIYLGWSHENPSLMRGVQYLADHGPSLGHIDWLKDLEVGLLQVDGVAEWIENTTRKPGEELTRESIRNLYVDIYYNYYATQVLHHYGGPEWEQWNEVMRDFLVETQTTEGNARGSWEFQTNWGSGSSLYATTMAAMTLEVYYRYLPLYDNEQIEEVDFPLD